MYGLFRLIDTLLWLFEIVLLVRVIMSWFRVDPYHPVVRFIYQITEPVLAPVRNILAPYQRSVPLDFSPLVVFILIDIIRRIIF
jgi:YggT family protein